MLVTSNTDRVPMTSIIRMSRPMVLVFLLVVLIITSQFEWKQQFANDLEATPSISQKQQQVSQREEVVKEKAILEIYDGFDGIQQIVDVAGSNETIILVQEKHIQKLNELVQNLREQLQKCKGGNDAMNSTANSLSEKIIELE
ncbi:hypothetical protein Syun_016676 [Stephania yunnanensis]|uniref:Uncharacterized protein n=1 Tax=Stephania yunnanensis TaxID=152371 RepID=A0AAP0J5P2_9MAGN